MGTGTGEVPMGMGRPRLESYYGDRYAADGTGTGTGCRSKDAPDTFRLCFGFTMCCARSAGPGPSQAEWTAIGARCDLVLVGTDAGGSIWEYIRNSSGRCLLYWGVGVFNNSLAGGGATVSCPVGTGGESQFPGGP